MQNLKPARSEYRIGPGASSLLLIFVAVCLTTVGILMLISALVDSRTGARSEHHIQAYYHGAADVQREIAELDSMIVEARRGANGDIAALKSQLMSLTDEKINLQVSEAGDNALSMRFNIATDEENEIVAELNVPLSLDGPRYNLTRHNSRNTAEWDAGFTFELFTGEFEFE